MRIIISLVLIAFSMLVKAQNISDLFQRSEELYSKGLKYFDKRKYLTADSLFGESLKLVPHPDTYYNRAVTKIRMGDTTGFARNLEYAMELGDTNARNIYDKKCANIDTSYIRQSSDSSSPLQFQRCITRRSKYTFYQSIECFDHGRPHCYTAYRIMTQYIM